MTNTSYGGARALLSGIVLSVALGGCRGASSPSAASPLSLDAARREGRHSDDPERIGQWALAEMIAPGGDASRATTALGRLARKSSPGLYGGLARGLWEEAHGHPRAAADGYVASLTAAQTNDDADVALVAWFAAVRLHALRGSVSELWGQVHAEIEPLTIKPGRLGWRAAAELMDWKTVESYDKAVTTDDAYDARVVAASGCARGIRLAGPFGHGAGSDRRRNFPAEETRPWPPSWPADPQRGAPPHILKVEQHRCLAASSEETGEGIFYAEAYFTTGEPRDLLVTTQGALAAWVDGVKIVDRDLREWGVWQRFGGHVHVGAGRHRVLARLLSDATTLRILNPDGTSAGVNTDGNPAPPWGQTPARVLDDVNPLDPFVRARRDQTHAASTGATATPTSPRHESSPLQTFLAAYLAHVDSMDDVASAFMAPLTAHSSEHDDAAAALSLEAAATYVRGDPAFPEEVRHRDEQQFRARAVAKDPGLWTSRVWLAIDAADQRGLVEGVEPLRKLANDLPDEPEPLEALARVYAKLGWRGERMHALEDLSKRFPDHLGILRLYLGALEEDGPLAQADTIAARIKKLDPDAEVDLDRALARHDWKAAIAELERLKKRRPDRKEIANRIADVLARSGDPSAAAEQLRVALSKNPEDGTARFRLADRALAAGDADALRKALAEALQAGARGDELRRAIELVEGATNLEPYRVDGRAVIKEFERWEKAGKHMDGITARVLDYAALWVHPDGSSEMLEHEIQRMQSQEAVGKEAEQTTPTGLVLRMRVIKPDGSVLEPEPVAGKPTLTMPHLEVGDYLEIEHVAPESGDGQKGQRYHGPTWFFREEDRGYWRSEFVTLTPKDRPLELETRGNVPKPVVRDVGTFVERKWRVDESPPAPDEPDSVRPQEFLPSVRLGWGISIEDLLTRLVDAASDETPLDPRVGEIAAGIVRGTAPEAIDERVRRLYHWVLTNVEDGQENDGRRVVTGRSGSRQAAFLHVLRELHLPVELAVVKDRLAPPPLGKISEVETYDALVLRVTTEKGVRWLTVRDKFAPFGYVPADLRGQPAVRLVAGTPRDTVPSAGSQDGVSFSGTAALRADGSGQLTLEQSYLGKVGTSMRNVFDRVPQAQLHDFVESKLVGRNFPGARVTDVGLANKEELDKPLIVRVRADVPQLARPGTAPGTVVLKSLFPLHLAQLATLPDRQTPLLIGTSSHVDVRFEITTPTAMRMPSSLPVGEVRDGERMVTVRDAVHGHALYLDRTVDIPAGRVQPGADYARFSRFTQDADELVEREIVLGR